jgi:hypothetical protein
MMLVDDDAVLPFLMVAWMSFTMFRSLRPGTRLWSCDKDVLCQCATG